MADPGGEQAELELARRALAGEPAAVAEVDRLLVQSARPRLLNLGFAPSDIDEAMQSAREHLLVGSGGPPALARFSGRGSLAAFVTVVASNRAHDLWRNQGPTGEEWDKAVELVNAEHTVGRDQLNEVVTQAVREAVAALSARERALLRFAFYDNLSHAQIGGIYGAHRQTVASWLERAIDRLRSLASQRLVQVLGASAKEVGDMLDSTIDLGLSLLLK